MNIITLTLAVTLSVSAPVQLVPAPDAACASNVACYSSYLTYRDLVDLYGPVSIPMAIKLTIVSEYWVAVDPSDALIHHTSGMSLREFGREAIARNLYQACGDRDIVECNQELYWFLSGFQPWVGWKCVDGDCQPSNEAAARKATKLSKLMEYDNPYLNDDIRDIITYADAKAKGWTYGAQNDRPWQWFNHSLPPDSLGLGNSEAVLYVEVLPNCPAYRFATFYTYAQTQRMSK